jgi:hypothetical protein
VPFVSGRWHCCQDYKGFFAGALAAFVDLVGVGRAPIMGWRQFEFLVGFRGRAHADRMAKYSM